MKKYREIGTLIKLLDDSDPEIFSQIEEQLLQYGTDAVPYLEDAWGKSPDAVLQDRIEKIVHKIQFDSLKAELKIWTLNESHDLLKGAILASRYQFPDLDEKRVYEKIEKIKRDVWLELNDNLTALETVKVLNHIIYDVHGFAGNTINYHAPQNSFINNVVESRRGNPLTLSLLYSVIAQDLHIPVFGINLPEHFVLAYVEREESGEEEKVGRGKILFYINAFSKGSVFSAGDIHNFLKQLKVEPEERFFEPCSNVDIIQRLFRNLFLSYKKLGFTDKMVEVQELLNALSD